MYYDLLLEKGYKYNELYDMTLKELRLSLRQVNKGLGYKLYKEAMLIGMAFAGKLNKEPEKLLPELYPPKKKYKMPLWMYKKYVEKKGGSKN